MLADILRHSVRQDRVVARTGGAEFALIIEGAAEASVFETAERLRLLVEQTPFANREKTGATGTVTISMGICMASQADGPEDLYSKADRALYRSKVSGRNRVTSFSSLVERSGKGWMLYKKD